MKLGFNILEIMYYVCSTSNIHIYIYGIFPIIVPSHVFDNHVETCDPTNLRIIYRFTENCTYKKFPNLKYEQIVSWRFKVNFKQKIICLFMHNICNIGLGSCVIVATWSLVGTNFTKYVLLLIQH